MGYGVYVFTGGSANTMTAPVKSAMSYLKGAVIQWLKSMVMFVFPHWNRTKKGECYMIEKYVSERLLNEMPKSLINFLWYLWDVYCDPSVEENMFLLYPGDSGQRVTISLIEKTVEQDFGTAIKSIILIRKEGSKYYMSRQ